MKADERKARVRTYKEGHRPMGVYRVRSTATGRWWIGASADLPAMLNRQRAQLRFGVHRDRAMQDDWDRHGPESFVFEVVDTLAPPETPGYDPADDLRALEQLWRERLAGDGASGEPGTGG